MYSGLKPGIAGPLQYHSFEKRKRKGLPSLPKLFCKSEAHLRLTFARITPQSHSTVIIGLSLDSKFCKFHRFEILQFNLYLF